MEYWEPGVQIGSVHELIGNALIMDGEKADRTDLRGEPYPGRQTDDKAAEGKPATPDSEPGKEATENV